MTATQGILRMVAVFAILCAAIAAMFGLGRLFRPDFIKVTPTRLAASVTREAGGDLPKGGKPKPCERSGDHWTCLVVDTTGSGNAGYRVTMTDRHCWSAEKTVSESDGEPLADEPAGCVTEDDKRR